MSLFPTGCLYWKRNSQGKNAVAKLNQTNGRSGGTESASTCTYVLEQEAIEDATDGVASI
eukprot:1143126-Pelagomonas_calceolata.AAC.2